MDVFVWHWGRQGAKPRFAYELAAGLKSEPGVAARLSLSDKSGIAQSPKSASGVDLPVHTFSSTTGLGLRTALVDVNLHGVFDSLTRNRPDIAIGFARGVADRALMRHLREQKVPVVLIVDRVRAPSEGRVGLTSLLQKRLGNRAAGLVALSRFVGQQLRTQKASAGKPLLVVPHPAFAFADLDLSPPSPVAPLRGRKLRLLLPGRLKADKDVDVLIGALALVDSAAFDLRIAGKPEGDTEVKLRTLPNAELHLGWQSETNLIAHIEWADVIVLPYANASQSGLIPMANARARPVISTPVGGIPEQIEQDVTGILTLGVSAEALADAIRGLCDDPARIPAMGQAALMRTRSENAWAQVMPLLVRFLRDLAVEEPRL